MDFHFKFVYNFKPIKVMITKKILKTKPVAKVTFDIKTDAKKVFLVGEFNGWNEESIPMKKSKEGTFRASVDLETGKEYQFKYKTADGIWLNDDAADKYVGNEFAELNSVVTV